MNKVEMGNFWLPRQGSTLAPEVDFGWNVVFWVSVVLFAGVAISLVWFVVKYRRTAERKKTSEVDHNLPIEIIWTVVPSALVMLLFFIGLKGYIHGSVAPAESLEINVVAQRWSWSFIYSNGVVSDTLRVPIGRPVKLIMSSKDVIHSFFVPEFRIKQDVVPGRYTTTWFEATQEGQYTVFCAEYCGTGHSDMLATLEVMDELKYREWLESAASEGKDPAEQGKRLVASLGCTSCHSVDGSAKIGPTFQGAWGKQETLADNSTVTVDENYVRESILVPNAKLVKGFQPVMPAFKGQVTDQQMEAIMAYLKSLK